jgi:Cu+-exporting ATPase
MAAADAAPDPVCGMSPKPDTPHRAVHAGRTYRFCSARCVEKFRADPAHFLAPRTEPAAAPGRTYTCPMHPQIVREGPGSCPICGMALEPLAPSLDDEDDGELRDMTRRLVFAAGFTVPLFAIAMGPMLAGHALEAMLPGRARALAELALATPVCLYAAWPFYVRGWQSLVSRHLNMFTLIALGVSVAYGTASPRR